MAHTSEDSLMNKLNNKLQQACIVRAKDVCHDKKVTHTYTDYLPQHIYKVRRREKKNHN